MAGETGDLPNPLQVGGELQAVRAISAKDIAGFNPEIFEPIPDSRIAQRELRSLTTRLESSARERGEILPSSGQLRSEGRSTVFIPEGLFSYYHANYEVTRRYIKEYAQIKDPSSPVRILEIGAGVGWGARFLSDSLEGEGIKTEMTATNRVVNKVDQDTLNYASEIYGKENLRFRPADATRLSGEFTDQKYDVVIMLETIEHLPLEVRQQCIQQIASVLEGGGLLVMSTPSLEGHGSTVSRKQDEGHVWVYGNRQDLEKLVSSDFSRSQVNRLNNRAQIEAFGGKGLISRIRTLSNIAGIGKIPESLYLGYNYEIGKTETDKAHQETRDTYAWLVVAQK